MENPPRALGVCGLVASVAILFNCGSEDSNGSSSGGASSSGTSGSFGSSGGGGDGGGAGGEGGPTGNCSGPVDMYVMLDRSNSMGDDCDVGGNKTSKWCNAVNALAGYFKSATATGQAAALQFFPTPQQTYALCATGDTYEVPIVPTSRDFVTLPSTDFNTELNRAGPNLGLGTPTEAAIRGITRFTDAHRRGGHVTIGVLVTDGDPQAPQGQQGCNEDLTALSNLLQAHFAATHVWTFVVGMTGASFDHLETIAQGGNAPMHPDKVGTLTDACGNGNGPCRHWNVGDGDPAAFTAAMEAIQASADGCKSDGTGGFINPVK